MTDFINNILADFDSRNSDLDVFEVFSGTGTPGEDGNPDINDPNSGVTISDAAAITTLSSLGLTGISYGLMQYSKTNPAKTVVDAMKPLYEKIQLGKALEAAQEGKTMTKLMEFLPYVGVGVKRLNIEAIWEEVGDILKIMQLEVDRARLAIEPVDHSMDRFHDLSTKAFYGFGTVTALGASVTALTAAFHDRAVPLLDDFEDSSSDMDAESLAFAKVAFTEVDYRIEGAMGQVDSRLAEVDALVQDLPDLDALVDILAEAETLLDPIKAIADKVKGLEKPYEDFLNIADIIGAPIDGVLKIFENPPKVLPTIVGYKTITPGFWLTVPDPSWDDPFGTKKVWVPPVTAPIPGFKELFNPIPRDEVQKIIDLIIDLAGLPMELLEKALAPILNPLNAKLKEIMQPIIDKINPFDDYLDEFRDVASLLDDLSKKLSGIIDEITAAVAKLGEIDLELSALEEIGVAKAAGMATFFGTDADEVILGIPATDGGGSLNGAVLHGNGGNDTITGSALNDLLSGGGGNDLVRGMAGDDLIMGGAGNDDLGGGAGNDILIGGKGNDVLAGGAGDDRIFGNAGNDKIIGGVGNDVVDGGAGYDLVQFLTTDADEFAVASAQGGITLTRTVDGTAETGVYRQVEEFQFADGSFSVAELLAPPSAPDPVTPGDQVPGSADDAPEMITGGDTNDLIKPGAGRVAFVSGGGGSDVFEFKEETQNGAKEIDVLEDFQLNEDLIRLSQGEVTEVRQTGGGVMLVLSGDGDAIYLRDKGLDMQDLSQMLETF